MSYCWAVKLVMGTQELRTWKGRKFSRHKLASRTSAVFLTLPRQGLDTRFPYSLRGRLSFVEVLVKNPQILLILAFFGNMELLMPLGYIMTHTWGLLNFNYSTALPCQNGWFFGRVPNGFWPLLPPLIFRKIYCRFLGTCRRIRESNMSWK